MWHLSALVLLAAATGSCLGANILYIDGVASPSHFIWHRSLMYGLAAKGHNVTALSVDVEANPPPNVHFIKIEGVYEAFYEEHSDVTDFFAMGELSPFSMLSMFNEYMVTGCELALKSKGVQVLLNYPDEFKFDVIINDFLVGPCVSALAQQKFGRPPYIAATGFHGLTTTTPISGAYSYSGMIPNHEFDAPESMSYRERFMNFLYNHWEELSKTFQVYHKIDKLVRQINPDIPYVAEFEKDARIILLNSYPVIQHSEPSMPSVISVGGMQIIKSKELPEDLKSIVENAKQGVILFSLGTNVRSDLLGKDRIIEILNAMRKFPQYQFLWKFESDSMPVEVPKNVYIRKWMPQNDLLAHPNLKLFITHSGLLSTQEAIWHGVPIIGFPVFADQHKNINYCVQMGVAKKLSISKIKSNDLVTAVQQLMTDQRYRDKMAQLSKLFRDQKEPPLERAIWWVEWVLRNPAGSTILQSNAINISWLAKYSFDVIIPLVMLAAAVLHVLVKVVSVVFCRKNPSKKAKRE
ncbi:UDP-glucosyltransferase 2 [Culex quinquefasciatus]|uniref:UDP-glucuronosyltransferase n=1 Tax=Culex pipiens TaxID=7175 RepID=A0A8D8BKH2_CULPI|nr:UDP-glucosyltransferase 2 [Culex quinquefasciatus]XP_039431620.1 UDP-glucosyltransferase 2-like [Culex pipiens pallens]